MDEHFFPKLRSIETTPITQDGNPYLMLRDPLRLHPESLILSLQFAPLLHLCDGTKDMRDLSVAFEVRHGQVITLEELEEFIQALDDHYLLETSKSNEILDKAIFQFRDADKRTPSLAGVSYPSNPEDLRVLIDGYLEEIHSEKKTADVSGVISPHIDYKRGHRVYAEVWRAAEQSVQNANLVIILGTDHYGDDNRFSLTLQNYATPYGVLPTAGDLVQRLVKSIGEEAAFRGELYHAHEHSIELALVWLHHMNHGEPFEVIPILCGSILDFFLSDTDINTDDEVTSFLVELGKITQERNPIIVAAADLAHVGASFGGFPLREHDRDKILKQDEELIDSVIRGDASGFYSTNARLNDRNNVCGFAPIYYTLRLLKGSTGELIAYEQCDADQTSTSIVSICGMVIE